MHKGKDKVREELIWNLIKEKVDETEYGSLTIIIHNGKIVQIDNNKKTRFE